MICRISIGWYEKFLLLVSGLFSFVFGKIYYNGLYYVGLLVEDYYGFGEFVSE